MTLGMLDMHPVTLDGAITSSATLDLLHGSESLTSNNDNLYNELRVLHQAEIEVSDFEASGLTHQVHAWEVLESGELQKWPRSSGRSVSGPRRAMDADVFVVAVAPGVAVPDEPAPEAGPPAPGTVQKKVRVKVGKQGALPFR